MKQLLPLVFFMLFGNLAMAQHRTDNQMHRIASSLLKADRLEVLRKSDSYCIYTNPLKDGFVVVGRQCRQSPVLGYSSSKIDVNNMPGGLSWWLNAIESVSLTNQEQSTEEPDVEYTEIPNFITTTWGQRAPYNALCPQISGRATLTGCVATALAQVLNYYKYPAQGCGTYEYTVNASAPYMGELSSVYNWDIMEDNYDIRYSGAPSEESVAQLIRDCGYATGMNYWIKGSNAYSYFQAIALTSNFSYDKSAIRYAERNYYSNSEWMSIIYSELEAHHPVLYTGFDENNEGHAFLFSGVDSEGRLYINWGWDGVADGFFDISDLAPVGIQGSTGIDHFNYDQEMVYGITNDISSVSIAPKYSEFVTKDKSNYVLSATAATVKIAKTSVVNNYYLPFQGTIDLVIKDINSPAHYIYSFYKTPENKCLDPLMGIAASRSYYPYEIPSGTYKVFLATKSTEDTRYQPVRCGGGPIFYEMTKFEDGSYSFSEPKDMDSNDDDLNTGIIVIPSVNNSRTFYTIGGQRISSSYQGISIVHQGEVVKKIIKK